MSLPARVTLVEVGPRDGLQNEPGPVPLAAKLALVEQLADSGLPVVEVGSFVSPKWVPQMADSGDLFRKLRRRSGTRYLALTPNLRGLEAALAAGVEEVAVFAAASEGFSRKNLNCSIDESLERFAAVAQGAKSAGLRLRGYVSCGLGCPYEGEVAPEAAARVAVRLAEMGCTEISLGDTIGTGTPGKARALIAAVARELPVAMLAAHFHDTYGQALANLYAVLEMGVAVIDASVAGLGGCPYAQGASGNVATEDVLYMLNGLGIETGVDLDEVIRAGHVICRSLGRPNGSKVARARLQTVS